MGIVNPKRYAKGSAFTKLSYHPRISYSGTVLRFSVEVAHKMRTRPRGSHLFNRQRNVLKGETRDNRPEDFTRRYSGRLLRNRVFSDNRSCCPESVNSRRNNSPGITSTFPHGVESRDTRRFAAIVVSINPDR